MTWGATESERRAQYPCDEILPSPDIACWRAVDVDAPAAVLFRWLCQLRLAPYSYDWIDNLGRRSPPRLVAGVGRLEAGQRFIGIFELVDFRRGEHITLHQVDWRQFCEVAVTYSIRHRAGGSRLVVKLVINTRGLPPLRWVAHQLGPAADLVMMRRQLLNLKRYAEATARHEVGQLEAPVALPAGS